MTEEIRDALNEFQSKYPKSFKVVLGANDFHLLETVVSKNASSQFFEYTDSAIISHISQCLAQGKDVVLQGAGKNKMIVHSAKGLL